MKKAKFKKGYRVLVELESDNQEQPTHIFGVIMRVLRTLPPGIKLKEPMYSVNTIDGDISLQCEKYLTLFKEKEIPRGRIKVG